VTGVAAADPIAAIIRNVDAQRMREDLFHLSKDPLPFRKVNYTIPGHAKHTLDEADDFIQGRLEAVGYAVDKEAAQVQAFRCDKTKTPKSQWYSPPLPEDPWFTAYNLYAKKTGNALPDEIILAIAHKDSQSWIDSPGANDNAIGTAGVIEMARVLADYPSRRCIWFLFCNEEHMPWTSITAANNAKARGDNIVAVFNTDGIGAKSAEATQAREMANVVVYTTPEGERLADLMDQVVAAYAIGLSQTRYQRPAPGDDDGSFIKAGYPAALANIGSYPYADPNYHSEEDVPELTDVENAALAVQAIIAAILRLDMTA
jgi:hypothetical protein